MVEPLKKRRRNGGALYQRRPEVEAEIEGLEARSIADVLACVRQGDRGEGPPVSSEAIVHILRREVRVATASSLTLSQIDGLLSVLVQRAERTTRRHIWRFDEIDREQIVEQVTYRIDDIWAESDIADYAEVNFNDWLMFNRLDAIRKQKRKSDRVTHLGDGVEDLREDQAQVAPEDIASTDPTPEAIYAQRESREKARLPSSLDGADLSPENRLRIAAMVQRANLPSHILDAFLLHHYLGMKVSSGDPDAYTLTKKFGKSDKTIRLWIERAEAAFAKLREATHEHESGTEHESGIGATGFPR